MMKSNVRASRVMKTCGAVFSILLSLNATAENSKPLQNILVGLIFDAGFKCGVAQEIVKNPGKHSEDDLMAANVHVHLSCVCLPNQIKKLRAGLSPDELKAAVTKEEFERKIKPAIFDTCAAERIRATYADGGCARRFAKEAPDGEKFCKCMSNQLAPLADGDLAAMAAGASKDFQAAADARATGAPPPEKSTWFKRFNELELNCKAGRD